MPEETRLTVLHVTHYPVFGGPHNQAVRLDPTLRQQGVRTIVVVPSGPGNAAERLVSAGVETHVISLHRLRASRDLRQHLRTALHAPREIRRLRRLIRDTGVDIVQIAGLVNPHGAIAARLEGVPVVWQLLDTRSPWPVAAAAMVWVRALADVVMSTGSAVLERHPLNDLSVPVVTFIPPVDLDLYRPRADLRAEVRLEWGLNQSAEVIGSVANINPQKGILELVRAFGAVRAHRAAAHLVLVGAEYPTHAAYSNLIRAEMAQLDLSEGRDVTFLGDRSDVERQLAGMDLFALFAAPRSEGITTAILEAMAVGLPVVSTDVGAIREVVDPGRTGVLIGSGDIQGFSIALTTALQDRAWRQNAGSSARKEAESRFGAEVSAGAHVSAYRLAIGAPLAGDRPRAAEPPIPVAEGRVVDGLDVFVDEGQSGHDELDHHHRASQSDFYDRAVEEQFEVDRPHGAPRLYRYFLYEKIRRAIKPIRFQIAGSSALVICGGSGMDAEYLTRAGAVVTTSDLSAGAARRARDRAEKYGLEYRSIVADAGRLPFGDAAVDLVSVHDGLHHLDDPYAGLAEMARVARRWVVVTEPARASATELAIRFGLAQSIERAGNRVIRLNPDEVRAFLEAVGFDVLRADRYAMYYPHHPGLVFRVLSLPLVFHVTVFAWHILDRVAGRFGNKLVVVARRGGADSGGTRPPTD